MNYDDLSDKQKDVLQEATNIVLDGKKIAWSNLHRGSLNALVKKGFLLNNNYDYQVPDETWQIPIIYDFAILKVAESYTIGKFQNSLQNQIEHIIKDLSGKFPTYDFKWDITKRNNYIEIYISFNVDKYHQLSIKISNKNKTWETQISFPSATKLSDEIMDYYNHVQMAILIVRELKCLF